MHAIVNFDVACFVKAAEELLRSDETLRALSLLDNLPSFYRQNPPAEITKLKHEVQARIATASFYSTSEGYELTAPDNTYEYILDATLRGLLLEKEVKELNNISFTPHILDYGPGEYSFVRALISRKYKFTYEPSYVNHPSYAKYKPHFEKHLAKPTPDHPIVYFAGEVIEHLYDERELAYEMHRRVGLADIIHVSTPNMTYDYTCKDWRDKGDIGHLRTYTHREFAQTVMSIFPEYDCQVFISQILHARCVLKETKYGIPKEIKI